jgi:hypothetical protein
LAFPRLFQAWFLVGFRGPEIQVYLALDGELAYLPAIRYPDFVLSAKAKSTHIRRPELFLPAWGPLEHGHWLSQSLNGAV